MAAHLLTFGLLAILWGIVWETEASGDAGFSSLLPEGDAQQCASYSGEAAGSLLHQMRVSTHQAHLVLPTSDADEESDSASQKSLEGPAHITRHAGEANVTGVVLLVAQTRAVLSQWRCILGSSVSGEGRAFALLSAFVAVMILGICCTLRSQSNTAFGEAVRRGIERYDRMALGVDVKLGSVKASLATGVVEVQNLVVYNPPGYRSPYLLYARHVMVDLDMNQLVRGRFQCEHVTLEQMVISDVHVILEMTLNSSNVNDVLNFINAEPAEGDPAQKPDRELAQGVEVQTTAEGETFLTMNKVAISRVHVNVVASLGRCSAGGSGMVDMRSKGQGRGAGRGSWLHFDVADIHYADFKSEVGEYMVDDLLRVILKSILKTALSNVPTVVRPVTGCC